MPSEPVGCQTSSSPEDGHAVHPRVPPRDEDSFRRIGWSRYVRTPEGGTPRPAPRPRRIRPTQDGFAQLGDIRGGGVEAGDVGAEADVVPELVDDPGHEVGAGLLSLFLFFRTRPLNPLLSDQVRDAVQGRKKNKLAGRAGPPGSSRPDRPPAVDVRRLGVPAEADQEAGRHQVPGPPRHHHRPAHRQRNPQRAPAAPPPRTRPAPPGQRGRPPRRPRPSGRRTGRPWPGLPGGDYGAHRLPPSAGAKAS